MWLLAISLVWTFTSVLYTVPSKFRVVIHLISTSSHNLSWDTGSFYYLCRKQRIMFEDEFKHEVGRYLESQTEKLFVRLREAAAEAPYYRRTGRLNDALWNLPTAQGTKIEITYPLHIRFLDMKKSRSGKKRNATQRYTTNKSIAIWNQDIPNSSPAEADDQDNRRHFSHYKTLKQCSNYHKPKDLWNWWWFLQQSLC